MEEQRALPFAPRLEGAGPYRPSPQQDDVALRLKALVRRLRQAQSGLTTIALCGPEGSGKSRLLQEAQGGADALPIIAVTVGNPSPLDVFAEINEAAAAREVLVLEARRPPDQWFRSQKEAVPPDIVSRLEAVPLLTLGRPGPEALMPVLLADLARHGHVLSEREAREAAAGLPRHFGSPRAFCRALDQAPATRSRRALLQWAAERADPAARTG